MFNFIYRIKKTAGVIQADSYGDAIIELEKKIRDLHLVACHLKSEDVFMESEFPIKFRKHYKLATR